MKINRFIFSIIIFLFVGMIFFSCENIMGDFLYKPPGIDVTEDSIFVNQNSAETFIVALYRDGMHCDFPRWDERDGKKTNLSCCATDEAENVASWYRSNTQYNIAALTVYNNGDGRRLWRWRAIRNANILMEKIHDVKNADPTFIKQAEGQARFIRALNYFEMLKYYGGVPILRRRLEAEGDIEKLKVPRSTFEEVVSFIVADCDTAAMLLPDEWPISYNGKATKGAALMLKSRTLLYAASPLFNTNSPYIELSGHNDLIGYGNYDVNRWQTAADAANAVLEWAPDAGCKLITEQGHEYNYEYAWRTQRNSEVIMDVNMGVALYYTMVFKSINNFYIAESGTTVTHNFVQKYEKRDGSKQEWSTEGGDSLQKKYSELDYRFKQTIAYNKSYWNSDFPVLNLYQGAVAPNQPPLLGCYGGTWLRKWMPAEMKRTKGGYRYWILFRLAEAYLNYAEALNEVQGPVPEAYRAVNTVRARSGMADFPPNLSKEEFREKIRNERSIELAFEDHRMWDVYRWEIAENEGIMKGNMYGIKIYQNTAPNREFSWEPYVFEIRSFNKNMYLHPFMQTEVEKGYIIQNPGW